MKSSRSVVSVSWLLILFFSKFWSISFALATPKNLFLEAEKSRLESRKNETKMMIRKGAEQFAMAGLVAGCAYFCSEQEKGIYENIRSLGESLPVRFAFATLAHQYLSNAFQYGSKGFNRIFLWKSENEQTQRLTVLRSHFVQKGEFYSELSSKKILNLLRKTQSLIDTGGNQTDQIEENLKLLKNIAELPLNPDDYLPVREGPKLREFLDTLSLDFKNSLESIVNDLAVSDRIRVPSLDSHSADELKDVFYFQGPTGTGKTFVAKNFFRMLGYHPRVVKLDSVTHIMELDGQSDPQFSLPGVLAEVALESAITKTRPVLILDEASDILRMPEGQNSPLKAWLKDISDPLTRKKAIPSLGGVEISLDKWIIVLTGVQGISDDQVRRRIRVVQVPRVPVEKKKEIALKTAKKYLKKFDLSESEQISDEDLTVAVEEAVATDEKFQNEGVALVKGAMIAWVKHRIGKNLLYGSEAPFEWNTFFESHRSSSLEKRYRHGQAASLMPHHFISSEQHSSAQQSSTVTQNALPGRPVYAPPY